HALSIANRAIGCARCGNSNIDYTETSQTTVLLLSRAANFLLALSLQLFYGLLPRRRTILCGQLKYNYLFSFVRTGRAHTALYKHLIHPASMISRHNARWWEKEVPHKITIVSSRCMFLQNIDKKYSRISCLR
ncbi:hypothetical protein CH063_13359, partial [Colletotrichum higginsianum]